MVHVRNRIWAYHVANMPYLAPNQEAFQGEYSVGPKAKIQAQGLVNDKVTWGWTFLTVTSDSLIPKRAKMPRWTTLRTTSA
jgi:hypothetical protein